MLDVLLSLTFGVVLGAIVVMVVLLAAAGVKRLRKERDRWT
jgi:uncharacterized membrane-anchored protein